MIGTITTVRHAERFAFLTGKDGDKFYAPFKEFTNRPLCHVCMLEAGLEVEFEVAHVHSDRRQLRPMAVNVLLPEPVAEFLTEQVESVIEIWDGRSGFSRNTACGCSHIFVYIGNFITDPQYLTSEFLRVGSRIVSNLEHVPGNPNATAREIELFQPEGFDASVLPVV